ncbi:hypothetical protein ACOME3_001574 [Neoechinorhynchus agilis]
MEIKPMKILGRLLENGQPTEQEKHKETNKFENSKDKENKDDKETTIKCPDVINGSELNEVEDEPQGKNQSDDLPFGLNNHKRETSQSANRENVNDFHKQDNKLKTESRTTKIQDVDSQCKMLMENLSQNQNLLQNANRGLKEVSVANNELNVEIQKMRMTKTTMENDLKDKTKKC